MKPELLIKRYDKAFFTSVEWYLEDNGYYEVGMGYYRKTFADTYTPQRSVIKVPREKDGFEHNIREAYAYRQYRNRADQHGIVYAPCRLLSNGCLLMSFVSHVPYDMLPAWSHWVDASQVGKFKDRFVAYDSGCDIPDNDRLEALEWAGVIGR